MNWRVLIVDDSPEFLMTARRVLEAGGLEVVSTASTGTEALRLSKCRDVDVILVDVELGTESGFEVAERLRQVTDRLPIVLISGHSQEDLQELIDASPAIGFLTKSQLTAEAINDLLKSGQSTAG
jgi:CheY-like chemotaxis protein